MIFLIFLLFKLNTSVLNIGEDISKYGAQNIWYRFVPWGAITWGALIDHIVSD